MKKILNGALKPCEITVGHDAHIGGCLSVRGHARVHHNLRVDGYLEAAHLKSTAKGLFRSAEQLTDAYPRPEQGWWALVGEAFPAEIYVANHAGIWEATGRTAGQPELDASGWFEELLYIEQQNEALGQQHSKLNTDIAEMLSAQTQTLGVKIDRLGALMSSILGDKLDRLTALLLRGVKCTCNCNCGNGSNGNGNGNDSSGNDSDDKPDNPRNPDNPSTPKDPDKPTDPQQPIVTGKFDVIFVSGDSCSFTDIAASTNVIKDADKQHGYNVTCTPKQFLWICIPSSVKVEGFKSSGFELPVEDPVTVESGSKKYNCWRTCGRPQSSQIKIEIF